MYINIGICQLQVGTDKAGNLERAARMIKEAAQKGADIVTLPEMFNCPYQLKYFPRFAEEEKTGESIRLLAGLARENDCYIVGGSIPEREGERYYNTSFVFDRQGRIIAKHRKVHLFDVMIPGGVSFQESAILTPGNRITSFQTEYGRFGLLICYDLRFPENFRLLSEEDPIAVIIPAAFNLTTGPAHWETLFRARAIDNQVYMIGVSPARDEKAGYVAYGHSLVVDPWGDVIMEAGIEESVEVVTINTDRINEVRRGLPLLKHRRQDLYQVVNKRNNNS